MEAEAAKLREMQATLEHSPDIREDREDIDARSIFVGNVDYSATPEEIQTQATITLDNGSINKMHLVTRGRVPGVEASDFTRLANEAEKKCPVSNLLRNGLAITLDTSLL